MRKTKMPKIISIIVALCALAGIGTGVLPEWLDQGDPELGKTLQEIAMFVAAKLATMAGVQSTATHFVLKKYKDKGIIYDIPEGDMRTMFNL